MELLGWILFGLIAGVIANMIDPEPSEGGIFGAVILGILGAVVGGFLANLVVGEAVTGINFTSLVVSVLGALLLLFVGKALRRG